MAINLANYTAFHRRITSVIVIRSHRLDARNEGPARLGGRYGFAAQCCDWQTKQGDGCAQSSFCTHVPSLPAETSQLCPTFVQVDGVGGDDEDDELLSAGGHATSSVKTKTIRMREVSWSSALGCDELSIRGRYFAIVGASRSFGFPRVTSCTVVES